MAHQCPICGNEIGEGTGRCPSCGYRMLESTQSFEPVKMGSTDAGHTVSGGQAYELRIVRGPQTGVDIALREGTLSIGRDPRCDVFLNDMTVSRDHAFIEVGPNGCILRDNDSYNGVWVNDRMVTTCLLKSGDLIQIGAFCIVYRERA